MLKVVKNDNKILNILPDEFINAYELCDALSES